MQTCRMYQVYELVFWDSVYVNTEMETLMKRSMNRLNSQQWFSVPPNPWYWVFKKNNFPKVYRAIIPYH